MESTERKVPDTTSAELEIRCAALLPCVCMLYLFTHHFFIPSVQKICAHITLGQEWLKLLIFSGINVIPDFITGVVGARKSHELVVSSMVGSLFLNICFLIPLLVLISKRIATRTCISYHFSYLYIGFTSFIIISFFRSVSWIFFASLIASFFLFYAVLPQMTALPDLWALDDIDSLSAYGPAASPHMDGGTIEARAEDPGEIETPSLPKHTKHLHTVWHCAKIYLLDGLVKMLKALFAIAICRESARRGPQTVSFVVSPLVLFALLDFYLLEVPLDRRHAHVHLVFLVCTLATVLALFVSGRSDRAFMPVYRLLSVSVVYFSLTDHVLESIMLVSKYFNLEIKTVGLTLLAFGNTIGDIITGTCLAKKKMGTAALLISLCSCIQNLMFTFPVSVLYSLYLSSTHAFAIDRSSHILYILLTTFVSFVLIFLGYVYLRRSHFFTLNTCVLVNCSATALVMTYLSHVSKIPQKIENLIRIGSENTAMH